MNNFIFDLDTFSVVFRASDDTVNNENIMLTLPEKYVMYDVFTAVDDIAKKYKQKDIATMARQYLGMKQDRCRQPARTAAQLIEVWVNAKDIPVFPVPVVKVQNDDRKGTWRKEPPAMMHPQHGDRKARCYFGIKRELQLIRSNIRLWRTRDKICEELAVKYDLAVGTVKLVYTEVRQDFPVLKELPHLASMAYLQFIREKRAEGCTEEYIRKDFLLAFGTSTTDCALYLQGKKPPKYQPTKKEREAIKYESINSKKSN